MSESARSKREYALGVDLGGSSVKGVVVTPVGEILYRDQTEFDPSKPMDWADRIRDWVDEIHSRQGGPALAIGLAAPGLVSAHGRSIAFMPGRLSGLEGLEWSTRLRAPGPVPILNDAHAALMGEVWLGAALGLRNVVLFTLGTGVGGAAMVDGRLLQGEVGRAGHLGHMSLDPHGPLDICQMPGSVEVAIGNCTIEQRSGGRFHSTHELVKAHQSGDEAATRVWLESVHRLAAGIASAINILDPARVIVGGGIARCGDALFEPLRRAVAAMEWCPGGHRVSVAPAQLGEYAGALGAARHALNNGVFS